jgi:predicted ATPase/DNA-binding winged helix-turn-helix (wHTH) protein
MPGYIEPALSFGPFTLHRSRKLLLEGEKEVRLGERTLELLIVLIERAGEVVRKQDLIALIWPAGGVEETTLRAHIAALRTVLGEGQGGQRYIVNVPARGYCFVAQVERPRLTAASEHPILRHAPSAHNLPVQLTRVIGRDHILAALVEQLSKRRFISLVGSAGMGKSSVALATGERLLDSYADGVRFVDLSLLADSSLVPSAIAAALDAGLPVTDPIASLASFLAEKSALLILDNCEHVADMAVEVAVSILKRAPGVNILATSREPLRAEGEWIQRLPPLNLPAATATLTAVDALSYSAIALFVERAIASVDSYVLNDVDASLIAEICRRLDGMPLAIELAAARLPALGVRGLMRSLDDRLRALTSTQRTGRPRHRTLTALLDWSHQMLSQGEKVALRRLSVFRGRFTLDAALAVAIVHDGETRMMRDNIVALASKSLMSSEVDDKTVLYRLLETTRAYAFQQLVASNELSDIQRRHALLMCEFIGSESLASTIISSESWIASRVRHIEDVRAALEWAFAPGGDSQLGVRLTTAAIPLCAHLVLLAEFRDRVDAARKHAAKDEHSDPLLEMRLNVAFMVLSAQTTGPSVEIDNAAARAVILSEDPRLGDYRGEAINAGWSAAWGNGRYAESLRHAQALKAYAKEKGDSIGVLAADRMTAQALHFLGRHDEASALADRVIAHPTRIRRLAVMQPNALDRRVSMRIVLARILWIQGRIDQAVEVVNECIFLAASDVGHGVCQVLALAACPIALWIDDREMAGTFISQLHDKARKLSLNYWERWAGNFSTVLVDRVDPMGSLALGPMGIQIDEYDSKQWDMFATLDIDIDHPATFDRAVARECGWCAAEVYRARGNRLLKHDQTDFEEAQRNFEAALKISREQHALSWELRAVMSLSRLWIRQGKAAEAKHALSAVYEQFTEGHESSDLRKARGLLEAIHTA